MKVVGLKVHDESVREGLSVCIHASVWLVDVCVYVCVCGGGRGGDVESHAQTIFHVGRII